MTVFDDATELRLRSVSRGALRRTSELTVGASRQRAGTIERQAIHWWDPIARANTQHWREPIRYVISDDTGQVRAIAERLGGEFRRGRVDVYDGRRARLGTVERLGWTPSAGHRLVHATEGNLGIVETTLSGTLTGLTADQVPFASYERVFRRMRGLGGPHVGLERFRGRLITTEWDQQAPFVRFEPTATALLKVMFYACMLAGE